MTCSCGTQIDKLNTEQLEVAIQERDRELIIDFYAAWCGPCVLLAKELELVRCPVLPQMSSSFGGSVRIFLTVLVLP